MLHRFVIILSLFTHSAVGAIEPTETQKIDLISMEAREALHRRLVSGVVSIERRVKLRAGMTIPGRTSPMHSVARISGLCADSDRGAIT